MRRRLLFAALLIALPVAASAFPKASMDGSSQGGNGPRVAMPIKDVASSGKVVETMSSGGYSYILIQEKAGDKKWYAIPETKVAVGDQVSVLPGVEMQNFSSKTLGRTFDRVFFSPGLANGKKAAAAPAPASAPAAAPAAAPAKGGKVAKATGPGAYTVGEIFGKRKALNGKKVTVRGRVVKISTGILKRNWIHIEDGTGKTKKTRTLVVTSTTLPKEGDTVTVQGTLASDRDFGSGYKYDAIIENATVTKN